MKFKSFGSESIFYYSKYVDMKKVINGFEIYFFNVLLFFLRYFNKMG